MAETVVRELVLQLAEHMWAADPWRGSRLLATELAWAFAAPQMKHVLFLEALEWRLVAQFWVSLERTVTVQRRIDAAVFTAIAACVDRFTCRLRRGGAAIDFLGVLRATRDIPVWMLSPGVCSAHRLEATESSLQDGSLDARDIFHRQLPAAGASSGSATQPGCKAVAGVLGVEAARAGFVH